MKLEKRTLENEMARRELSYKQMARLAGITEKTLQAARNGEEVRINTAGKIAAALGVSLSEIIEGEK